MFPPQSAPYVFASYSRWDRRASGLIDRVLNALRYAQVVVWLAPDSIPAGMDWKDAISTAIDGAGAHLFFVSKRYPKAKGMQRELEASRALGIPLIVLLLDAQAAEALPPDMESVNVISLYAADTPDDFTAALLEIMLALPVALRGGFASPRQMEKTAESVTTAVQNVEDDAPIVPPRSVGYVFISYAEEDTAFVVRLRDFLRARGYGYWDYQETERKRDLQLSDELQGVIQNATAVISVVSPAWTQSRWTKREYLYAESINVPIFVVRAAPFEPNLILADVTYIDFVVDEDAGFRQLDADLRRKGLIQ